MYRETHNSTKRRPSGGRVTPTIASTVEVGSDMSAGSSQEAALLEKQSFLSRNARRSKKTTIDFEHILAPGPDGNGIELMSARPARGSTQEVLLVHGAKHGAWCWENFINYFANRGVSVHALSLRGHGNSTGKATLEQATFSDFVADVNFAKEYLSLNKPVVVGHSLGGSIVQKVLEQGEFTAGVLLASMPPGSLGVLLQMFRRHPLLTFRALMGRTLDPVYSSPELVKEAFFHPDISEAELQRHWYRLSDESYKSLSRTLDPFLLRPGQVNAPMLVVGAENDVVVPPKLVHKTAARYGQQAVILSSSYHDMMLDPNWEQCAERILEFIG